uniref:Uncharacterized protein n=1 Tax=Glossina pallidipes TaxID=7398 RepID=A0A1B0ACC7_GLOPL
MYAKDTECWRAEGHNRATAILRRMKSSSLNSSQLKLYDAHYQSLDAVLLMLLILLVALHISCDVLFVNASQVPGHSVFYLNNSSRVKVYHRCKAPRQQQKCLCGWNAKNLDHA